MDNFNTSVNKKIKMVVFSCLLFSNYDFSLYVVGWLVGWLVVLGLTDL